MADKSKLVDALINYVEMPGRQLNAFFGAKPKANPLAAAKALKQMGGDVLGSIQSAYTAPSRALSGQLRPQLMMDENGNLIQDETNMAKEAGNFAMNVAGGGLGSTIAKPVQGGSNVLGTFVGRRGMENLGAGDILAQADKMKAARVPDERIWAETAQMAADKGLRGGGITYKFGDEPVFELSDDLVKVNPVEKGTWFGDYAPLENVYEHPDLYKAEPSLKSITVGPVEENYSFHNPNTKFIGIGHEPFGEPHRTTDITHDEFGNAIETYNYTPHVLGHEVNHAVQFNQDLPIGGNLNTKNTLNKIFEYHKEKYQPHLENIESFKPELSDLYKQKRLLEFSRILNEKPSFKPRDLFRSTDFYKYERDITNQLGLMPKKPGIERDNYIRDAHRIMQDKYMQENGITPDFQSEALGRKPSQVDYRINKIYKTLEPDYEKYREFAELRNQNQAINQLNPSEVYNNLTGEATSRLVQKRWNMTPEERAKSYPFTKEQLEMSPYDLIDLWSGKF